jgi:1-acyl-sn-glycerol-3-phosphate acyltransferase
MNEDTETSRQGDQETNSRHPRLFSLSPPLRVSLSSAIAQGWYATLWCVCWVVSQMWFRFHYTGRANVPMIGPVLLVSNHQSHLDPVLVGIASPRQLRSLARHNLFFWPLGWLISSLGAVPVDRERSALAGMRTILRLLCEGEAVLIFPEGTRTPHGNLQPLLPGFCTLARRSSATIVPLAINGAFAAMPRGSYFPLPRSISLVFSTPITPDQIAKCSDNQLVALVESQIAAALQNKLAQSASGGRAVKSLARASD